MESNNYLDLKEELNASSQVPNSSYPIYTDPDFNLKIAGKSEFQEIYEPSKLSLEELLEYDKDREMTSFSLNSHQLFVRNFLSLNTPYNNLLLYHGLGTGKTCTSIAVAIEKIKYMRDTNVHHKIAVVASPNVQDNFKKELFSEKDLKGSDDEWRLITCVGKEILDIVHPTNDTIDKQRLVAKIQAFIAEWFDFVGYTKFSNMITESMKKGNIDSFNDNLIIIDEIHNIRVSEDGKNKRIADSLVTLVKNTRNVQLLLLSATPMFNDYKEIVWLTNLMNLNDNRPVIAIKEIFDSNGNFVVDNSGEEIGLKKFVRKISGYISFVQGEDPINFPFRIFPSQFNTKQSLLKSSYPTKQFDGSDIVVPMKHIDLYTVQLSEYQTNVYEYFMQSLNLSKLDDAGEKMGYQKFQIPLNILNICYPNELFDDIQTDKTIKAHKNDIVNGIGKEGLERIFQSIQSLPFVYDKDYVEKYKRIFSPTEINKYSTKIKSICDAVSTSEGVTLIYSEKIYSGVLPMALALEEMGYARHVTTNLLSNKKKAQLNYAMITGNSLYSPSNKLEIEACVHENNINGDKIKVIIISRAGSEGIDLKYIRNVHILEPWYNMNRIEQVIGRAIRNRSHILLSPQKRNCSIYLYGTLMEGDVESIDLYVYRHAEAKSLNIGKVSRVLKETAIDCLLTKKENVQYFKNDITHIPQLLSNKEEISFDIRQKIFSSSCDYMESCSYKCMMYDNKQFQKLDFNDETDISSYNSHHIALNTNNVVMKIKDLFKEKYVYSKYDIINRICYNKPYSIHIIDTALNDLVSNKLMVVFDRYQRQGKIIQINDMYLFQPREVANTFISLEERSKPVDYKNEKLLIKFKEESVYEDEDKEDAESKNEQRDEHEMEKSFIINVIDLASSMKNIMRDENTVETNQSDANRIKEDVIPKKKGVVKVNDKKLLGDSCETNEECKNCEDGKCTIIKNKTRTTKDKRFEEISIIGGGKTSMTLNNFIAISVEMVFDQLPYNYKTQIMNLLLNLNEETIKKVDILKESEISISEVVETFHKYIEKNTITNEFDMKIFILGYSKKLFITSYDDGKWIEGTDAFISLFRPIMETMMEKYKKQNNFYHNIGLKLYSSGTSIFKIKDTTNKEVHNTGFRCANAKKSSIKEILYDLFGDKDKIDALVSNSKYKVAGLCKLIEFKFRCMQYASDNKIYFLDTIRSGIIQHLNIFKI